MFEKVLIAEDAESTSISVRKTLGDLGIENPTYVFYCDHAVTQIQKALQADSPFDLLITDLSFDEDGSVQKINDGAMLIEMVKKLQPSLKVLVFSVDNRLSIANKLKRDLDIEGYVPKGRGDAQDLKTAIQTIAQNRKHISPQLKRDMAEYTHDFTPFDIEIVSLIYQGESQKNIPLRLKEKNIIPTSLSSVEKRLGIIRSALNFSNNVQLISYCKEKNII